MCTWGSDSERREHGCQRKDRMGARVLLFPHTEAALWTLGHRKKQQQEAGRSVSWRLWAGLTPKESFVRGYSPAGCSGLWSGTVRELWSDGLYFLWEVARKVQCWKWGWWPAGRSVEEAWNTYSTAGKLETLPCVTPENKAAAKVTSQSLTLNYAIFISKIRPQDTKSEHLGSFKSSVYGTFVKKTGASLQFYS